MGQFVQVSMCVGCVGSGAPLSVYDVDGCKARDQEGTIGNAPGDPVRDVIAVNIVDGSGGDLTARSSSAKTYRHAALSGSCIQLRQAQVRPLLLKHMVCHL